MHCVAQPFNDLDNLQHCVARPFNDLDEALRIYNILIHLQHPNVLSSLGLWRCCGNGLAFDDKEMSGKKENIEVKAEKSKEKVTAHEVKPMEAVTADEVKIKCFITFPSFDGSLVDLPREELFVVEDNSMRRVSAYGLTRQGSKLFW